MMGRMTDTPDTPLPAEEPSPRPPRGGCLLVLAGGVLVAVGVPMLVLPGPGIAALLGGLALLVRGVRRMRP